MHAYVGTMGTNSWHSTAGNHRGDREGPWYIPVLTHLWWYSDSHRLETDDSYMYCIPKPYLHVWWDPQFVIGVHADVTAPNGARPSERIKLITIILCVFKAVYDFFPMFSQLFLISFNSLSHRKCGNNGKNMIFKFMIQNSKAGSSSVKLVSGANQPQ